jgi:hypothetical protein
MSESKPNLVITEFFRNWEYLWSKRNIRIWSGGIAILAIFIYTFFGGLSANIEHPTWYRLITSCILNVSTLLVSSLLCLRNGWSQRMPSGRNVWIILGFALLSFLCGSIFFSVWELVWGLNPAGSLGDPFFIIFYTLLPLAMLLAIVRTKLRLEAYQWSFLIATAAFASLLVIVITVLMPKNPLTATSEPSAVVQAVDSQSINDSPSTSPAIQPQVAPEKSSSPILPGWVSSIDVALKPHATNLNYFYVWSDVFLFCLATAIIMGFWGGRFSQAWILNAFAVVCFYVSDIWFAYAATHIQNYQSGFFLEIFWTFGAILFGIAAATEFDFMLSHQVDRHKIDLDLDL